ncbi:TPA_asm: VP1 [Tasmanian devil feces bidnavirus 1]|nr:TPA_asm: VP1 [Tasmanian devil feces bidnavirus 1]
MAYFTPSRKRGAEQSMEVSSSTSAKSARHDDKESGAGGGNDETDSLPIMHVPLKYQWIDVPFVWRSLSETLEDSKVAWFPFVQFPRLLFTQSTYKMMSKYIETGTPFTHYQFQSNPKLKLSKFVFMQESIIGTGSTPSTTTAPTQSSYIWKWCPKGMQSTWFKLKNPGCATDATYDISRTSTAEQTTRMLQYLDGVEDLEKSCFVYGGLDSTGVPTSNFETNTTGAVLYQNGPFYFPNECKILSKENTLIEQTNAAQPWFRQGGATVFLPGNSYSTNDVIPIYNYIKESGDLTPIQLGDQIEFDIDTGYLHKPIPTKLRIDTRQTLSGLPYKDGNVGKSPFIELNTEPLYASKNIVHQSRKYGPNAVVNQFENLKDLPPRQHMFLSIAPLSKPDGTQVKQSVSFVSELTWTMRFFINNYIPDSAPQNNFKDTEIYPPYYCTQWQDSSLTTPVVNKTPSSHFIC